MQRYRRTILGGLAGSILAAVSLRWDVRVPGLGWVSVAVAVGGAMVAAYCAVRAQTACVEEWKE